MQVKTQSGVVVGASHERVVRFLGIPFAAPPTQTRRFQLPQPSQDWTTPRPAHEAQPAPPQPLTVGPGIRGAARTSEDCLYLNVYAPESTAAPRPVLVWIFGGGYVNGDA
ncbi:MAG: carboxylesterase family protein, partial [Proteobacteria bacterium]|nr:carboxylesterase family protein [Pseudomonadota bacterium]